MAYQMFANTYPDPVINRDNDVITVVEKKIVAKSKHVSTKSDVSRPIGSYPTDHIGLDSCVYTHIRRAIQEQKQATVIQKKTKKILRMPVLLFLHDGTVIRSTIPFVTRKRGLGVFENKKQRDTCIAVLSRGREETPVSMVDIAYCGDLLLISPSDHPMKSRFFYTCGIREVMEFDLQTEEIQFSHAYYFFAHHVSETGLFTDRTFDLPSSVDLGPIPDFDMDDDDETGTESESEEEEESEFDRIYMQLYLLHAKLGKPMYTVDRMVASRPGDSFIEWAKAELASHS